MKHQALLTIQVKLKLAIIFLLFGRDRLWRVPRKRVARRARNFEVLKLCYIQIYIQLVFCCFMKELLIFNVCEL